MPPIAPVGPGVESRKTTALFLKFVSYTYFSLLFYHFVFWHAFSERRVSWWRCSFTTTGRTAYTNGCKPPRLMRSAQSWSCGEREWCRDSRSFLVIYLVRTSSTGHDGYCFRRSRGLQTVWSSDVINRNSISISFLLTKPTYAVCLDALPSFSLHLHQTTERLHPYLPVTLTPQ